MARRIEIRTERASSPVGLVLVGLAFLAFFIFIKRDSTSSRRTTSHNDETGPAEDESKPAEKATGPDGSEEYPRYRFINYTPEPPSPSPTEAGLNVPGIVRKEDGEYARKTVQIDNDGKPTDIQNFHDHVGSRTTGQESQLSFSASGQAQPERQTKNPEREMYNELVVETRGDGWHGEPLGAVCVHLLEKEGLLPKDIIENMRIMERISQPRPALYTDSNVNDEGDGDVYVYPWGNMPDNVRGMLVRFNQLNYFNIPNLAMLMWNTAPKGRIHWIRDHPLVSLDTVVKEAAEWRLRNPASTSASDYAIADTAQQVNLLMGWFILPYHGCGHHGPANKSPYHKLESWAATEAYTYLPNSIREGVSRREYLLLAWLGWLGRRWMMKRAFTHRAADFLDGSIRLAILPNSAKSEDTTKAPDLRLDVTIFVPTGLVNCCAMDQPPETQKLLSKAWLTPRLMLWALNRVMFEARPYVEDVTRQRHGTKMLEEGSYRVPYVRFVRLFLRPGVAAAERMRGTIVSSNLDGSWESRPFPRPPRLVVRAENDRIAMFLESEPGVRVKTAIMELMMHLRPQRIEFCNFREYHQVELAPGDQDHEILHSNLHDGSAMFIVMLSLSSALRKLRDHWRKDGSEGVAVENTEYNLEYRQFGNDPYARAVMPENTLIKKRHMWIDFGGVLPLSMTQDKVGRYAWPSKLETALYFTLPLLDRIEDASEPKKNQPATGQVLLDPRFGILESLMLPDPCIYLVFYAPDPTLLDEALENRMRFDEVRFWSQLRENFVYGLRHMMLPEPEGETPEARANRALVKYGELERLLNGRVHVAFGCGWQPNNTDPVARHLAFEYFEGHLSDEEKKVRLMGILGEAQAATLPLDAGFLHPKLDFGAWDHEEGKSPVGRFRDLNVNHAASPGLEDRSSDEESEGDAAEGDEDECQSADAELLRLRKKYAAGLDWIAHDNWKNYIPQATTFLANAQSLAAVEEMMMRIAEHDALVEKGGFQHYQTIFIGKCRDVADSRPCKLPSDYDKPNAAWSGQALQAARQVVNKQYLSRVKRDAATARNRLQPNLRDAKRVMRGELREEITRRLDCLAAGMSLQNGMSPMNEKRSIDSTKELSEFGVHCQETILRHTKILFGAPVTPENAESYDKWLSSDTQGARINDALDAVCDEALEDFKGELEALESLQQAQEQACVALRDESDEILRSAIEKLQQALGTGTADADLDATRSMHKEKFVEDIKRASIATFTVFRKEVQPAKGKGSDKRMNSDADKAFLDRFKGISIAIGKKFNVDSANLAGSTRSAGKGQKQNEQTGQSLSTAIHELELKMSQNFSSMNAMLTSKIDDFDRDITKHAEVANMLQNNEDARAWHRGQIWDQEYSDAQLGDVLKQYDLHDELLSTGHEAHLASRTVFWDHLIKRFSAELGTRIDEHWGKVQAKAASASGRPRDGVNNPGKTEPRLSQGHAPPAPGPGSTTDRGEQHAGRGGVGEAGDESSDLTKMTQKELKDALDILDQAKTTLHGSLVKGWGPAHDDARNRLQKGTLTEATTERIKEHYFQWWKKTIDRWAVEQQDLARSNAEHAQRYPPWGSKPSATWTVGPVDDLLKENEVAASLFMVAMKAELAAGPEFKKSGERAKDTVEADIALDTQKALSAMETQLEGSIAPADKALRNKPRLPKGSTGVSEDWLEEWQTTQGKELERLAQDLYKAIGSEHGVDAKQWAETEAGKRFVKESKTLYQTYSARLRTMGEDILRESPTETDRRPAAEEKKICRTSLSKLEADLLGLFNSSMKALKRDMRKNTEESGVLLKDAVDAYAAGAREVLDQQQETLHEQIKSKVMAPADWARTREGQRARSDAQEMFRHWTDRFVSQGTNIPETLEGSRRRKGGIGIQN